MTNNKVSAYPKTCKFRTIFMHLFQHMPEYPNNVCAGMSFVIVCDNHFKNIYECKYLYNFFRGSRHL